MLQIDLNDVVRPIIVDKEEGQFLGQVSSAILEDNKTVVAVYPKSHGRGSIVEKISRDGGLTWGERIALPESFATSMDVPTVFRTVDAEGCKRLLLFTGTYPIRMAVSEDDGISWSELAPIGNYGGMCVMGDVVSLGEPGKYMALFHDEVNSFFGGDGSELHTFYRYTDGDRKKIMYYIYERNEDGTLGAKKRTFFAEGDESVPEENGEKIYEVAYGQMDKGTQFHVNKIITRDGGLTWSQPQTIARHKEAHLCEPGAIRLSDGTLAVLIRENMVKYHSFIMFSHDNGETFTEPREIPLSLTGDRHTCRRLKDGRIAVTFRDKREDFGTQGDWILWIGTDDDLRNGGEGQYRFRLKYNHVNAGGWKCDCAYPGFHVLDDGTMLLITYGHWEADTPAYIIALRFNLEEWEKENIK